jgi:hypothetical protein
MRELQGLRGTVEKAKTAANEGWRSLGEMTGGTLPGGATAPGRWSA